MKLAILDRDGVINVDTGYIAGPEEWFPIPGSLEAIAKLNKMGYRVVVATNQSGIGRGFFNISDLNEIHAKMHSAVERAGGKIDAVFFCPHEPSDACTCRKPEPGMLLQAIERFQPDECVMFGDKQSDYAAAIGADIGFIGVTSSYPLIAAIQELWPN